MTNIYLVISSVIFPILALCWICCLACCIYRTLVKGLVKVGRTTRVEVMVSDRPNRRPSDTSTETSTVTPPLNASLSTVAARRAGFATTGRGSKATSASASAGAAVATVSTSTAPGAMPDIEPAFVLPVDHRRHGDGRGGTPLFYPPLPLPSGQGAAPEDTPTRNPMRPLQAPWPRLPPIEKKKMKAKKKRSGVPAAIRNFLETQR